MVTGTSVLGLKFEGGVVIAADMLGSYGSLARFRNISRIMRVNNSTMLGASGDYADFQYRLTSWGLSTQYLQPIEDSWVHCCVYCMD